MARKEKMRKIILGIFLNLLTCFLVTLSTSFGAGTTGANILEESFSSRALGMGEAFVGVGEGTNSIWYNPAGLSGIGHKEITSTGAKGLADISSGFLGYAHPAGKVGVLGGSFVILNGGKIELNLSGKPTETRTAEQDYLFTLSYGRDLFKKISIGVNFKVLHSLLMEEVKGTTFAGDLGLLRKGDNLSFGFSFQNLGPRISYKGGLSSGEVGDALPLTIRAGTAYKRKFMPNHKFIFALDGVIPLREIGKEFDFKSDNSDLKLNFGLEYWWQENLAVRGGYKFGYVLESFSFGLGSVFKRYQLDYALGLMGDLAPIHRISFGVRF